MLSIKYTIAIFLGLLNAIFSAILLKFLILEFNWSDLICFLIDSIAVIVLYKASAAIVGDYDAKV